MLPLLRTVSAVAFLLTVIGVPAMAADKVPLPIVEVPAEKSGLTHGISLREPGKYGNINWPWLGPLVDINGDGHLDILVCGHHGGTGPGGVKKDGGAAAVWFGHGDGTFTFDESGYHHRWHFGARDPVWIDLTGNGAVDGIVAEWARHTSRVMINDGTGLWEPTKLLIPGMLIDTNGDGRTDGVWHQGTLRRMEPPLGQWGRTPPEQITYTEVWRAEETMGWPKGVERGRFGGWREAYPVDLTGDHRNELVITVSGPGFHSRDLVTWVLTSIQNADGQQIWKDTTAERGLPTDVGHWLYPEDVDVDGHLDLVDLETGFWHRNDGKGKFARSPHRIFDPETRQVGRKMGMRPWSPDNDIDWVDLDNNGFRDLVTGTAHHSGSVSGGVFVNQGDGRFVEADGLPTHYCRGRSFGDVDGNGKLDVVSYRQGQIVLHRNITPNEGLHLKLAPSGQAEGFLGAKIWAYEAGRLGDNSRLVHYRQGFMAQSPNRSNVIGDMHIGLGQRDSVDVRVRFPSGVVREVRGAKAGTRVVIEATENPKSR